MKPPSRQELRARGYRAGRPVAGGQALLPVIEATAGDDRRATGAFTVNVPHVDLVGRSDLGVHLEANGFASGERLKDVGPTLGVTDAVITRAGLARAYERNENACRIRVIGRLTGRLARRVAGCLGRRVADSRVGASRGIRLV